MDHGADSAMKVYKCVRVIHCVLSTFEMFALAKFAPQGPSTNRDKQLRLSSDQVLPGVCYCDLEIQAQKKNNALTPG